MHLEDIENALILVGQNNTGKTTVLDAVRAVGGDYEIGPDDFAKDGANIDWGYFVLFGRRLRTSAPQRHCEPIPEAGGLAAGFFQEAPFLFRQ